MSTVPITSYFKKMENASVCNVSDKKVKHPDLDLTSSDDEVLCGKPVPVRSTMCKSGSPWSSPIIVDRQVSPTRNLPTFEIQKHVSQNGCHPCEAPSEATTNRTASSATSVYTLSATYGSDVEMTEEVSLKDVPTWLLSPCCVSSDSSDDDWLKPVVFHQQAEKAEFDNMSSDNANIPEHSHHKIVNVSGTATNSVIPLSGNTQHLKTDAVPLYLNDLKFLIVVNGIVSFTSTYSEVEVNLMSYSQIETFDVILSLNFLSSSLHIREAINFLMTVTSSQKMVPGKILVRLWKLFVEPEEILSKSESPQSFVHYFQYLLMTHPPVQSEVVREQYLHFLHNINSTIIFLLVSKEKWKVELLSVIVGILLVDYYHVYKNCSDIPPLFHHLFWKPNEHHFVNNTIRFLIQSALDIYKNYEGVKKQLQSEILSQLLFLVFMECDDVAMDVSITFSSIPNISLFTALSSLVPLQLRETVATNIHFESLSCTVYQNT